MAVPVASSEGVRPLSAQAASPTRPLELAVRCIWERCLDQAHRRSPDWGRIPRRRRRLFLAGRRKKKKKPLCSAQLTHVVTAVALLFVTVCRWLSAPRNGKSRECGGCPLVVVPLPLCRLFVSVFSRLFFPAGGIYFVLVTRCRSILICPRVQFSICPIGLHVQRRKEFQKFTPICLKCER